MYSCVNCVQLRFIDLFMWGMKEKPDQYWTFRADINIDIWLWHISWKFIFDKQIWGQSCQNSYRTSWHRLSKSLDLYWRDKHNSSKRYSPISRFDVSGRELCLKTSVQNLPYCRISVGLIFSDCEGLLHYTEESALVMFRQFLIYTFFL